MPSLINIKWVSDVDSLHINEYRGDEAHQEGDARLSSGEIQRVEIVSEDKPEDFDQQSELTFGCGEYRQFIGEDGKSCWCKPIAVDRFDLGYWNDTSIE